MKIILLLICIHFFADFILQNDKMALNKSKSNRWLGMHCLIYTLPFILFGIEFGLIVGATHFIIDYITSRINSYLWGKGKRHWFFVMIGFDQFLHITTLILFYNYFVKSL